MDYLKQAEINIFIMVEKFYAKGGEWRGVYLS